MTELRHKKRGPELLREKIEQLAGRYGTSLGELQRAPRAEGPGFMAHAKWEDRNPEWAEHAKSLENSARAQFIRQNGSDDFYEPGREFPCTGMLRVVEEGTKIWTVMCDVCRFEVAIPVEKIDPDELTKWRFERASLPVKFAEGELERTADNKPVISLCESWVECFRDKGGPIPAPALYGKPGRGKTKIMVYVCRRLLEQHGVDVMYVPLTGLLDELRAGFDDKTYNARWERAKTVECLALDDVGAGDVTEWSMGRVEALVDARYSGEKPIMIATNFAPSVWPEVLGARAASRLSEMVVAQHLLGNDRRQSMQMGFGRPEPAPSAMAQPVGDDW